MHIFSGSQTQSSKGRGTLLLEWISLKEMESGKNGNENSKKWNLAGRGWSASASSIYACNSLLLPSNTRQKWTRSLEFAACVKQAPRSKSGRREHWEVCIQVRTGTYDPPSIGTLRKVRLEDAKLRRGELNKPMNQHHWIVRLMSSLTSNIELRNMLWMLVGGDACIFNLKVSKSRACGGDIDGQTS